MRSAARLEDLLGVSPRRAARGFEDVEASLGVSLPEDVKECCSLYGDVLISDFIFLFGPEFMVEKSLWMQELVRDGHPVIPGGVLPDAGGMLHWGHTLEGDKFFLVDRGAGRWTVSAFRRNWGDWYESDDALVPWLVGVLEGTVGADWMPEWTRPHWLEVDA
ncbi:hypothetical protein [Streptomyces sp. NPDC058739]|uniref:hypothetical protein n=1 Tax=Streptomyces sp. NPDC058739 TaxID=3346618 RepID=UPI0036922165